MNNPPRDTTPQQIIEDWTYQITHSVKQRDLDNHLQLVSERIQIYGMPNTTVINYNEWRQRREFEFKSGLLVAISFLIRRVISNMPRRIIFNARESMLANNGVVVIVDKNIILEKEQDLRWRVVEESINNWITKKYDLK